MEDFKINVFNQGELIKSYKENYKNIDFSNI